MWDLIVSVFVIIAYLFTLPAQTFTLDSLCPACIAVPSLNQCIVTENLYIK